jgi:hypothetical protein
MARKVNRMNLSPIPENVLSQYLTFKNNKTQVKISKKQMDQKTYGMTPA